MIISQDELLGQCKNSIYLYWVNSICRCAYELTQVHSAFVEEVLWAYVKYRPSQYIAVSYESCGHLDADSMLPHVAAHLLATQMKMLAVIR